MSHVGDNVVSFLRNAATKLEELQVQTALGKAELSEKLEELKKDARTKISQLKVDVNAMAKTGEETIETIKTKMDHLEVQLALGKAETMEELKEQKKKIASAINDIKHVLVKN